MPAAPSPVQKAGVKAITRNKIRDHFRAEKHKPRGEGGTEALVRMSQVAARPEDGTSSGTEAAGCGAAGPAGQEADPEPRAERALFRRALDLIRGEFREQSWQAFWLTAVEGRSAAGVAEDLGMTLGAVRVAKSRVLRRLREEMGDSS